MNEFLKKSIMKKDEISFTTDREFFDEYFKKKRAVNDLAHLNGFNFVCSSSVKLKDFQLNEYLQSNKLFNEFELDQFEAYQTESDSLVLGLFDNIENNKLQLYFSAAKYFQNTRFALCCTEHIQKEFNLIENENIVFSSKYGEVKSLFKGSFIQHEIKKFISLHKWIGVNSIKTGEELKQLQNENEVLVLGLFNNLDNKFLELFYSIHLNIKDTKNESTDSDNSNSLQQQIKYAITFDTNIFEELNLQNSEHIVSFNKFDEGRSDFDDHFEKEKIVQFIQTNKFPLVSEYSDEAADRIFEYDIEILVLLFISKESKRFKTVFDCFKETALKFRGKVLFVLNDIDLNENKERMKRYGLKEEDIPAIRLMSQEGIKYKMQHNTLTTNSLCRFINEFFDNRLKPFLFSQDLPDDWNSRPVKVISASNFNQITKDETKNVLVLFYHPLVCCCEELFEIYEQLAEHFKEEPDYLIAKMDFTLNQLEDIQIRSCHEIKLFPKEYNEMVDYEEDDYSLEDLINFMNN